MNETRSSLAPLPFCHAILPSVSRTFALTIPQLPARLRDEVCVAYLICRVADTIEDHETLDSRTRTRLFRLLKRLLRNPVDPVPWREFRDLWPGVAHEGYERLVSHLPLVLQSFRTLPARTRRAIQNCVDEMIDGMATYAGVKATEDAVAGGAATPNGSPSQPRRVCDDLDQLENYCHYAAATVGGLLTRLFHPVFTGDSRPPSDELITRGHRFGLALQMTNVLKDYRRDLERGVAFLPPATLDEEDGEWRLSPGGLKALLTRVLGHLDEAERYVLWIPSAHRGARLFCLWALHLALRTLTRIASPESAENPKVSRGELAEIVQRAEAAVDDDDALERLYHGYRAELAAMIRNLGPEGGVTLDSLPEAV
ncbi:MAG: squalene/phytoene synthase family protein [bacterium]